MAEDTFSIPSGQLAEAAAPKRARVERKEEVKEERRRRASTGWERHQRLSYPKEKQDPAYVYRWINDSLGRLYAKTQQDDWDKVDGEAPRIVDIGADGQPMKAHLCRKRKEFYDADKAEDLAKLKEQEDATLNYKVGAEGGLSPDDPNTYVPSRR